MHKTGKAGKHTKYVYYFGYGANREPEMITAITSNLPELIGMAILQDYQLCIQDLSEITEAAGNPKARLTASWGTTFKSYVIVPKQGSRVSGAVFRMPLHERHMVDAWELVQAGWYDRAVVMVTLDSGKTIRAETQVLAAGQEASLVVNGLDYRSWVMPKERLLYEAMNDRESGNLP